MKMKLCALLALALALSMCVGALAAIEPGEYDSALLVNWTDDAIREAYGVKASAFKPSDPQPLTYIVTCEPVIDPRTGRASDTSWTYLHRTQPACAEDVLDAAADLSAFSLTLTDDPNRATYRAVISYKYSSDGYFSYHSQNARIPMYKGVLTVTLKNMLTGESAKASRDCWCFPEDRIEVSVLNEGIGERFYAGPKALQSSEITAFNDLLGLGIDALYNYCDDEGGGVCITDYLGGDVKKLELPATIHGKPVTGIGEYAFKGAYFTSVRLPETLTHIDKGAFQRCWELRSIDIPDSVTSVGANAFSNDSKLEEVILSDNVTELGDAAFSACDSLKRVRLPAGLTKIPETLMWGSAITSIDIPDGVTEIGKSAFSDCDRLKSVTLPESVRVIGDSAFNGCESLTEVTCAGEIELVDHAAFGDCDRLSSIRFQKGVKALGDYALCSCPKLKSVDLFGLESLGEAVFRWDVALTSVSLPETLTEIGVLPFGDHRPIGETYAIPKGLVLTVVEGSYAEQWAQEENMNYTSVAPPTEEELLAMRYPALQKGSKGEGVRRLQQALIDGGYLDDTADGSYGPKTAAAVSAAQEALGMEADGVASPPFQSKLYGE